MANATALQTPSRLDPTLIVLRRVDVAKLSRRIPGQPDTTMEMIGKGYAKQGLVESHLTWFKDGLILNDQPRTSIVTDEIMNATLGFAIARTDTGEVIRTFGADGMAAAQAAVAGAKITLEVANVALEDDDIPDDFDPANPGAYEAMQADKQAEFEAAVEAAVEARLAAAQAETTDDVTPVDATPLDEADGN